MPNWCANRLTVTGPMADLIAFRAKAKCPTVGHSEGSSHEGNPVELCPESFVKWTDRASGWTFALTRDADEDDPARNRIAAVEGTQEGDEEDTKVPTLTYEFLTRWGPPTEDADWLPAASRQFPTLTFVAEYAEPLMDFSGRVRYEGGKVDTEMEGKARDNEDLSAEAVFFY